MNAQLITRAATISLLACLLAITVTAQTITATADSELARLQKELEPKK